MDDLCIYMLRSAVAGEPWIMGKVVRGEVTRQEWVTVHDPCWLFEEQNPQNPAQFRVGLREPLQCFSFDSLAIKAAAFVLLEDGGDTEKRARDLLTAYDEVLKKKRAARSGIVLAGPNTKLPPVRR